MHVLPLACWRDTIAVGMTKDSIILLNAITGSQIATLSVHHDYVISLAFSANGMLLASGSLDNTIKLWDMQTGGVAKSFNCTGTSPASSISISADCTTIASGTSQSIDLWDIQKRKHICVIKQQTSVNAVCFSPLVPQYLISASDGKVQQWDIYGHQIAPTLNGSYTAFSSDGTQFFVWNGEVIEV